jgi:putative ABC transport system substrate-binding protein
MRRRVFITLVGGATAWPFTARAERADKLPTVGVLATATPSIWDPWTNAFVQRLHELGWVEGKTIAIEYRWAEGHIERYADIAAEFVQHKVDVILTDSAGALKAKQATATIPIVFALSADPLGTGLVASLARPGGNVTGLSVQSADLAGKKIEFLREAVPSIRRLAIMGNVGFPAAVLEIQEAQKAAGTLQLAATLLEIRRAEDIASTFEAHKDRADALYVCIDPLVGSNIKSINTLALSTRWPTVHGLRDYVAAGGLMSYGASISVMFHRAAEMVDEILRGGKPADMPVEQPTNFALVINLTAAKALGLTIPQSLINAADEVIE